MSLRTSRGTIQTGTILDKIVARKFEEIEDLPRQPRTFGETQHWTPRDFLQALQQENISLIAEVKHASPSKGILIENFDPVALATLYEANGAAALSILTDRDFFMGDIEHLRAVKRTANIPVLRKDFIIDERQIDEAALAGADAILLIVAILDDARLRDLYQIALDLKLTALIEVHTAPEMERALKLGPALIGINNRDLHTFHVDLEVTHQLAKMCPTEVTLVAESGIFTPEHVEAVAAAGARAILVGESIVKSADIGSQVRSLSSIKRTP